MQTYLISYDLGIPENSSDYKLLIGHIKSYGKWAYPLKSQWFVKSSKNAEQIRKELSSIVDSNDKILVIDVTDCDWATWNLPKEITNWMQVNM